MLAERVYFEKGLTVQKRVAKIYQLASGYQMNEKVRVTLENAYSEFLTYYQDQPDEAKSLLEVGATPPKATTSKQQLSELAALMAVAHIVLNTDEILTIE